MIFTPAITRYKKNTKKTKKTDIYEVRSLPPYYQISAPTNAVGGSFGACSQCAFSRAAHGTTGLGYIIRIGTYRTVHAIRRPYICSSWTLL